jgi:hypothetical protein
MVPSRNYLVANKNRSTMSKEVVMKKSCLITLLCAMLIPFYANAYAISIGVDPTGTGNFTTINHINYFTDDALSVGYDPAAVVPVPDSPYNTQFILQTQISGGTLNGSPAIGFPNSSVQWTAVTKFNEQVIAESNYIDAAGHQHQQATFSSGVNPASTVAMYMDSTTNADPNTAHTYNDGTEILTGHVQSLTSSFDFNLNTGIGTGSFNVLLAVDSMDSNYLDFPTSTQFIRLLTTGTLNIPAAYHPTAMWDGTATSGGILLKFDGSTDISAVPEPGTLFLLGLGLIGLASLSRKRLHKQ